LCDEDEDGADVGVDDDGMFWNVSTIGVDDIALDASKAP